MSSRSNRPRQEFVTTFLSCSVRPEDRALVDAIDDRVLAPMGFRCLTVGRSISVPEQADDAIQGIIDQVDCLAGIATVRLEATDRTLPNRTLSLASPYVLQETAMAHQRRLPFLIFKTPEVTLQGVTSRNLYIEIRPDMPNGQPGTYAVGSFLDWLSRPNCFGTYYYFDAQCKGCSYKAEEARRRSR